MDRQTMRETAGAVRSNDWRASERKRSRLGGLGPIGVVVGGGDHAKLDVGACWVWPLASRGKSRSLAPRQLLGGVRRPWKGVYPARHMPTYAIAEAV